VVLDAPLLFESKILEWVCYPIVVVYIDDSQKQVNRMIERAKKANLNLTEEEALTKIGSQMPIGIKIKKGDILVDNSGSRADLEQRVTDKVVASIYQRLGYIDKE
jgi:dephospho-CoA kinase